MTPHPTHAAEEPLAALPADALPALRAEPALAITAIAGRDSVAAAVAAVREQGFTAILPTVVHTGTEYGDFDAPHRAVDHLRELLGDDVAVYPPLHLASPRLWAALNGRFLRVLADRYPHWSPCSACHLYVHLLRIPLSWALGSVPVVTGERETHRGQYKASQTPAAIDAEVAVFAHAGVTLLEPLQFVDDEDAIVELVGPEWPEGARQLSCVLSGNYLGVDGEMRYDPDEDRRFAQEFLLPAGRALVDAWRETPHPDYLAIVRDVLHRTSTSDS
jgi:hypothetical protein